MKMVPQLIVIRGQADAFGEVYLVGSILMALGALLGLTLTRVAGDPERRRAR